MKIIENSFIKAFEGSVIKPLARYALGLPVNRIEGFVFVFSAFKNRIVPIHRQRIQPFKLRVSNVELAGAASHLAD